MSEDIDQRADRSAQEEPTAFWRLEYQLACEQYARFCAPYVQSFFIYAGIVGVAVKFALDAQATAELRYSLGLFGVACALLFFVAIHYADGASDILRSKRDRALKAVFGSSQAAERAQIPDEFVVVSGGHRIFSVFNGLALLGWLWIGWLR